MLFRSILGANPLKIYDEIISMQNNFDWLHLDIMDGHFVRNLSFGPDFARALNKNFPGAFIDVHLMVDELKIILPLFSIEALAISQRSSLFSCVSISACTS